MSLEEESELYLESNKEVVDWERPVGTFQLCKESTFSLAIHSVTVMSCSSETTLFISSVVYWVFLSYKPNFLNESSKYRHFDTLKNIKLLLYAWYSA